MQTDETQKIVKEVVKTVLMKDAIDGGYTHMGETDDVAKLPEIQLELKAKGWADIVFVQVPKEPIFSYWVRVTPVTADPVEPRQDDPNNQ